MDIEGIEFDEKSSYIKRGNALGIINPADMHAIEESVHLKEYYGGKCIGICMGGEVQLQC